MHRIFLRGVLALLLGSVLARAQGTPVALVGGTVVDVTNWGHSAKDQPDSIVIVQNGRITEVGPRTSIPIPNGARVIDCTGKFILPGLIDGFAGMSTPSQANANLYMGVTTVVARSDAHHGTIDFSASPAPHIYPIDSVGTTDEWNRLNGRKGWTAKLRQSSRQVELSPDETLREMVDTAKIGTRVLWIGPTVTAANTQWIITRAHQMGLVTYGEFAATPYRVGVEAGVDALVHMGRYEIGVIPDELQRPLVDDPEGAAATTAYDYSERLPPTDMHVGSYAHFLATHHAALMPTFATYFQRLPDHRNLWKEPVASILEPRHMYDPPDPVTGEMHYPLPNWSRHLPGFAQRTIEESIRKKADQSATRLWRINQAFFAAYPHYLAGSGAPVTGAMAGISLHVELEMLVRLGLTPREALAAATSNYAVQFNWNELGMIAPGRRADILVVDGDPSMNIWNARRISTLMLEGTILDRDALLNTRK